VCKRAIPGAPEEDGDEVTVNLEGYMLGEIFNDES
jgi:hypothetical protein